MAASKVKIIMVKWCFSRSIAVSNVNRMFGFVSNSLCTMIESPEAENQKEVAESPDLPVWVRFLEKDKKTLDDDFVPPSISYWLENHKHIEAKGYHESTIRCKNDSEVHNITKILVKPFESPESVVEGLNDCNVTASETLVAQMLKRFDNNWKSAYGVFIWAKSQTASEFSPETYDSLVDCLGKSKKFDIMWQIIEQMDQIGENYVTLKTIAKVIRRLVKGGRYEDAIDAFRRIEQFGIKKDHSALNILVDALAKEKNVELANEIFLEFKNEIPPNNHTFNALIHGWSKARKFDKAQSCMEEMKKHGICPDVVSYTSLIEAYCYEKDFRKVHEILEEMQEKGHPPNVITYTIVMHALGKSKEINEALKIYVKMKASNCVPDKSFYSSLIYILCKSGRLKDAREVFDEMTQQGIERDTLTYNTMITSACKNNQEEGALKLLQEMEKSGIKPNFDTYAPLLKMCCNLKRMKVLSFLLTNMVNNDVSLGLGTYSLLVRGLSKSGKLKHACLFLEDAVLKGIVPYDTMYKLLETELDKKGMSEEKKRIQELRLIKSPF